MSSTTSHKITTIKHRAITVCFDGLNTELPQSAQTSITQKMIVKCKTLDDTQSLVINRLLNSANKVKNIATMGVSLFTLSM